MYVLQDRWANLGRPASALIREALQANLAKRELEKASSFALGKDLFGRYSGPKTLTSQRKSSLAQIWEQKRPDAPAHRKPVKRAVRAKA